MNGDIYDQYDQNIHTLFSETLGKLEKQLRSCEDSVSIINSLLQGATEFYGAESACVYEVDWSMSVGLCTYEWHNTNKHVEYRELPYIPLEQYPYWSSAMKNNEPIIIPDTTAWPKNQPEVLAAFNHYDIRALLATPFSKRINYGYVCVINPMRFKTDTTLLFLLSYAIVAELNEIKLQNQLLAAERKASRYPEEGILVKCFNGLEITTAKGTLTEKDITSDQCYSLLCYMLLTRNVNNHTLERLYDIIRPYDKETNSNPYSVVKNVVYRTRKFLSIVGLATDELIMSKNGSFCINPKQKISTDFERFQETFARFGNPGKTGNINELYEATQTLYCGALLPRLRSHRMFMSFIAFYQNMYIKVIKDYAVEKLRTHKYLEAQKAVINGLLFEPDDGCLHYLMICAICLNGNSTIALSYLNVYRATMSEKQIDHARKMIDGKCKKDIIEMILENID